MTSRGPGRASRTPEMEEKEQLRRQIRLLQGLIDDYKNLHGTAAPAASTAAASRWPPPAYGSSRAFGTGYPRPGQRGFSRSCGPAWRKKYSLVNRPPRAPEPPGDCAAQPPLRAGGSQGPDTPQPVLERQVQLSSDQNMVIKIKPPSKPGTASAAGGCRGSREDCEDSPWSGHRPQEGEGEPPGGQRQPSRPGRAKGSCGTEDPLLVCQKEPGKPRVVKSVSSASDGRSEPWRTVSESAVAGKARFPSSTLAQRGGAPLGRKAGSHSGAGSGAQLLGDGSANAGLPDQPAAGLVTGSARPASGPRQAREASLLLSCRTSKFRKNSYKWVAASVRSPRATRRALSPRAASEAAGKAPCGPAGQAEKPQLRAAADAKPRRPAASSALGACPSKYKWKASSPSASSSSSFRWHSETGSKDHASHLPPVPSRSPPGDRPAVGPSSLKPLFSETPLSAYKVKSRTKIIRRRGGASLPGDKKNTALLTATAKSQLSLRRRQALRGKGSPVLKKAPGKGLTQVTRHRLCRAPPGRAHPPTKEASSVHTVRTPPTSKVIKTRYRIVKKTPVSPLNAPQLPLSLPSWRSRRLSLSRSLVLNRLRPVAGGGKAQPSPPRWRNRGYRCIGGVLYKVSANKLSKTCGRPGGDGTTRPLVRAVLAEPLEPSLLTPPGRPEQPRHGWGGLAALASPGESRARTASRTAERALIFRVSLPDKGDEPVSLSLSTMASARSVEEQVQSTGWASEGQGGRRGTEGGEEEAGLYHVAAARGRERRGEPESLVDPGPPPCEAELEPELAKDPPALPLPPPAARTPDALLWGRCVGTMCHLDRPPVCTPGSVSPAGNQDSACTPHPHRFLRGTCKKTDGTCPFSHHVSKEKMPVCSYFLKGICSNSNCPYSHVYVSRKAEVCTDFLKGYCPLGAKCKKKHTLLCPDFSRKGACPRGAQCQLLHRSRKRLGRRVAAAAAPAPEPSGTPPRSKASSSHGARKSSAAQRPPRQTPSSPSSVSTAACSASPPSSPGVLAAASGSPLLSPRPLNWDYEPRPSGPTPSGSRGRDHTGLAAGARLSLTL
ncbi:zinc finger CCCH domain-containing protein 3 [Suricata suricatta]|uniref:zinc finger CCCH domain-containing protein 3 n=1 Tax=Suricata suricatta TaxID=37032 RepID=UPI0011560B69|nr:zinc finger CCCH domain-containing protein 3 [Suricata suricatta]